MNFPSLSFIYTNAVATFRRFPLAITSALITTVCAIWYLEIDYQDRDMYAMLQKAILISALGISLFTAIVVAVDRWKPNTKTFWIAQLLGLFLLVAYFFLLPQSLFDAPEKHSIRLALFFIGSHLLVAVAPFIGKGEINGFWQFNKTLFLRFLTAVLYAHVLFVGLAVALLSVDYLLGVDIESHRYGQLWIIIAVIFTVCFFLSGVPEDLDALDQKRDYPGGLKFFTQYVLIPLVSIYMIILYLYAGKIIISWNWPEGWVANLILSFSIVGILSLLLLYPIRNKAESTWIRKFSKGFYLILLPLVCMLLLAIWRRISEYGFTENRYFVLIAGIWLGCIALYFLLSKSKNIKVIPVSLTAIIFLISFGPWGAISVSESNQMHRLKSTLVANNIFVNGQITESKHDAVSVDDTRKISAGVLYLVQTHGVDEIQSLFDEPLRLSADTLQQMSDYRIAQHVVEEMGVKYVSTWSTFAPEYMSFSSVSQQPIRLGEFEWIIKNQRLTPRRDVTIEGLGARDLTLQLWPDSSLFSIREKVNKKPVITVDLQPKIDALTKTYGTQGGFNSNIPPEEMVVDRENEAARVRLLIYNIQLNKQQNRWTLENLNMDILLRF